MPTSQSGSAPEAQDRWTPTVILHRAEELRRRLRLWHVKDMGRPVQFASFLQSESAIRQTFRAEVFSGDHGDRPQYMTVHPGRVAKKDDGKGLAGTAFRDQPSETDKQLTLWLLRDFYEHLRNAGDTPQTDYLRLKFERLLDAPSRSKREPIDEAESDRLAKKNATGGEGPYSLVDGRSVALELLDDLVEAARALFKATAADDDHKATVDGDDQGAESELPRSVRIAYRSYCYAESRIGCKVGDAEAWHFLREDGLPTAAEEFADYRLPACDTWCRYVRQARKALNQQKNTPRAGRASRSRSIVRNDDI
jgi:hypothetical protein